MYRIIMAKLLAVLAFFCIGSLIVLGLSKASAEEIIPVEEVVEETEETSQNDNNEATDGTENEFDMSALVDQFTKYLKETYGEDYEKIYNGIIEKWGSIEAYLLQFGDQYIPEEYNAGWKSFVNWLGAYAPVWATPLAIAILIIICIIGKKAFNNIVKKVVDTKLQPITNEMNKQSAAITAQCTALKTIMPNTEKGAAAVKELEEKEKELSK